MPRSLGARLVLTTLVLLAIASVTFAAAGRAADLGPEAMSSAADINTGAPRLAVDSSGRATAVWAERVSGSPSGPLRLAVRQPGAAAWGPIETFAQINGGWYPRHPDVAASGSDGTVVIGFVQDSGVTNQPDTLDVVVRNAAGATQASTLSVAPTVGRPRVVANAAGDVAVTWRECTTGSSGTVCEIAAAVRPAGAGFESVRRAPASGGDNFDAVLDDSRRLTVAYSNFGVYATTLVGSTWSAVEQIGATGAGAPDLSVAANGEVTAAFLSDTLDNGTHRVHVTQRSSAGVWQGVTVLPETAGTTDRPRVATAPDGTVEVVWEGAGDIGEFVKLFATRRSAGGWHPSEIIATAPSEHSFGRWDVAADAAGDFSAMWYGCRSGPSHDLCGIAATQRPAGGAWRVPRDLGDRTRYSVPWDLRLGVSSAGDAVAIWTQNDFYSVARAWNPDVVAPQTTIDSGPERVTSSTSANVAFTTSESGSPQCRFDDGLWTSCSSPWSATNVREGAHRLEVRAVDAAGNPDSTPAVREWAVRLTTPPSGSEPMRVSDPGVSATWSTNPRVAVDGNGTAIGTWLTNQEVRSSTAAAAGGWSAMATLQDVNLGAPGAARDRPAAVEASVAGGALAAWVRCTDQTCWVQASHRPPGGEWRFPEDITSRTRSLREVTTSGEAITSDVRVLAAPNGSYTLVWRNSPSGGTTATKARTRAADGTWGPTRTLPGLWPTAAAIDEGGTVTAVGHRTNPDNSVSFVAARLAPGEDWGPLHVLKATADRAEVSVAANAAGHVVVGWVWNGVEVARFTPGTGWGTAEPVDPAGSELPVAVAIDAAANATVAWTVTNHGGTTTYTVRTASRPAGGSWGPATDLSSAYPSRSQGPQLVAEPSGRVIAAWDEVHNDAGRVMRATRHPGQAWGQPVRVSAEGTNAAEPWLAVGGGRAALLWVQAENTYPAVYAFRFATSGGSTTPDTTAPETTLAPGGPSGTHTTRAGTFSFSANEPNATFECKLDGGQFAPCGTPQSSGSTTTASHELTNLSDGPHTFQVRARDAANNTDATPATREFTVSVPPAAPANDDFAGATSISGSSVTTSGSNSGATKEQGEPNHAANVGGRSVWWSWTAPSSGQVVVDTCGSAFDTLLGVYTGAAVGTLSPVASSDDDDSCGAGSRQSSASFAASAGTTYRIAVDGYDPGSGAATGAIALHLAHTPAAPPDTTAPDTTLTGGPTGTTASRSASFGAGADEANATFECRFDGATQWSACGTPATVGNTTTATLTRTGLTDGEHSIEVRAVDAAGNRDASPPGVRSWTVDGTAPNTTLSGGPTGTTSSPSASFDFSANEGNSTFQCRFDGAAAWSPCGAPTTTGNSTTASITRVDLPDGAHSIEVRALDSLGNADASPETRNWTVDTVAPTVSIRSAPAPTTGATRADIDFAASEAVIYECSLDGAAFAGCTPRQVFTGLAPGPHSFAVRGRDAANNASAAATASWTVEVGTPERQQLAAGATAVAAPPTADDPLSVSVTSPNPGTVAFSEGAAGGAPAGYSFLGQQVDITAPDATAAAPLRIVLRIDASAVPSGVDETNLTVFRNGVPVALCAANDGTASPAPCVAQRQRLGDGDLEITVLTDHASTWNLGRANPPPGQDPPPGSDNPPGGGNPPGDTSPPGGDPPVVPVDPGPAKLSIAFPKRVKLLPSLKSGFVVSGKTTVAATITGTVTISKATAIKLKLGKKAITLGRKSGQFGAGGFSFTFKPAKKLHKKLAKAKTLPLVFNATAQTASGRTSTLTKPIALYR